MGNNDQVAVEKFLAFWTTYNIRIIEVLIASILLLSIYIAFRALFGKKEAEPGAGIDAAQLEKTLQKILDSQSKTESAPLGATSVDMSISEGNEEAQKVAATLTAEVEKAKAALVEKTKEVETLKIQVVEAQKAVEVAKATAAAGGGAAAPAAAPASAAASGDTAALEAKIKDLEARLAEYEIIAEDIADLSMYKEENEKLKAEVDLLKAEIERLKAQPGAGAAVSALADPALDIPSDVAALMEQNSPPPEEEAPTPAPAPVAESPAAEPVAPASAAAPAEAAAAPAPAAAEAAPASTAAPEGDSLISDDLMKEFEAAVSQQKEETGTKKEGESSEALMDEFEKFVKKG